MTSPAPFSANCPNCGAPIRFLWAQAVQTTCAHCRAVLVRRDLDLSVIGQQADFPHTGSPIQIGTEGTWRDRRFLVIGRLAYAYPRGRWNEWHCRMNDGSSAWLSDAQLEYAMTAATSVSGRLPDANSANPGDVFVWHDVSYEVSVVTAAQYIGTEGELPFTTAGRDVYSFVDLQNDHGGLATVDFSDAPPTLYVGEYVDFAALELKNLRTFEGW